MTGGEATLPADAWQGNYRDRSGTPANPNDLGFVGGPVNVGPQVRYAGDIAPVTPRDYAYAAANPGDVNAAAVGGVFGGGGGASASILSVKLGMISAEGWESAIHVYNASGSQPGAGDLVTLFGTHTGADVCFRLLP